MTSCSSETRGRGGAGIAGGRGVLAAALLALSLLSSRPARAEQFECLVEPYLKVSLSSSVPGILDEVLVDRGDRVEKGQVVARLKSDVERADYDLVKARAEFAARNVERNKEMYRKQMISIHEKDELETEARLLRLELKEAEEKLKLRTLRSPIDGVVLKRFFSAGEFITEDPVLSLAQLDPLRVEVVVPVALNGKIRVGTTAPVTWLAPPGGSHRATVKVVDPVVDAASGTIGIRLELPNPQYRLPAGAKCLVDFPMGD